MKLCVLGSGSKGNAVYVEAGKTRVLFDAGFSAKEIKKRLTAVGVETDSLSALVISHEHTDHVRGLQVMSRHFPVYATADTLSALEDVFPLEGGSVVIKAGERFEVGGLKILPLPLPHDAADPVGFVLEDEEARAAIITDLGMVPRLVRVSLHNLDLAVLEANHDLDLLINGPYPWEVKQRVKSRLGHLANSETASLVQDIVHPHLQYLFLAHLSQVNNRPELAQTEIQPLLPPRTKLHVCHQDQTSALIRVKR